MTGRKAPALMIWALGATQIIGYGTLYYSFSILAPAMAQDLSLPLDWLFGILSLALLTGGLLAPQAGKWADRYGAGRLMVPGSIAAAVSLGCAAMSSHPVTFALSLVVMELAACFVLYGTAFAAIVQVGGSPAPASITHLTLIAGFASTLFWPLTSALHAHFDWQEIYLLFAALNLGVCLPIHWWISRLPREVDSVKPVSTAISPQRENRAAGSGVSSQSIFLLMLAGFAVEGFVLASILVHMVPLLGALGVGASALMVSALFGPSQVASRLLNMVFGGRLSQTVLATISAGLLALALVALLSTTPWLPGLALFAILFGLGSGLASIVGGTLPLELFGRAGYGARLGWVTAARQFSSALAPFLFAVGLEAAGPERAVTLTVIGAGLAVALFGLIALQRYRAAVAPLEATTEP
ncbi:MAG: arsenite efflux MFS transporter ArsK [Pseudorhizobium sp.]